MTKSWDIYLAIIQTFFLNFTILLLRQLASTKLFQFLPFCTTVSLFKIAPHSLISNLYWNPKEPFQNLCLWVILILRKAVGGASIASFLSIGHCYYSCILMTCRMFIHQCSFTIRSLLDSIENMFWFFFREPI